ncbi:unnamed protein product [Cuscuta campestris]|uniref:Uncharacterized protein n=1 Tax=Cuscuta campestris TaxID=132261 RepID=A0A484NE45_9ASTE|nr:unnamed protein product [Cuscuta campestris]
MLRSDPHTQTQMIIAQKNDKFFSRLLSKEEKSSANKESSFRFFSCESSKSSIPFRWESQPGTPKHPLSAASLPPLTPPPSYNSSSSPATARLKSSSRGGGGGFIARTSSLPTKLLQLPLSFSRRYSSKKAVAPSISSSSCSSSFSLPPPTPTADSNGRRKGLGSDFRLRVEEMFRDDVGGEQQPCSGDGGIGPGGKTSKSLRASRSWLCFNNL